MLRRERHVGEDVVLAVVHQRGQLWPAGPELVGDLAPGLPSVVLVGLQEGLAQGRGDHRVLALRHVGERVAHPSTAELSIRSRRDGDPKIAEGHAAALPSGAEDTGDRLLEPFVGIGDDQLHALQATAHQGLEEARPESLGLGGTHLQADDLAAPVRVNRHGDYRRDRDDPPALALLEIGGVEPEIGPVAVQRPLQEGLDPLVDLPAELGDLALGDAGQAHGLHEVVDPSGGDAADPGLLDHRDQGLLAHLARLQERREVGPLPQLRHPQGQRAEPRVEGTVTVAVPVVQPVGRALVPAGTDQALHIALHQDLQHRLGDGAQKVSVAGLLQQLGQWQSVLGHRALRRLGVRRRNGTLAAGPDDRLVSDPAARLRRLVAVAAAGRLSSRNSTTSEDANQPILHFALAEADGPEPSKAGQPRSSVTRFSARRMTTRAKDRIEQRNCSNIFVWAPGSSETR